MVKEADAESALFKLSLFLTRFLFVACFSQEDTKYVLGLNEAASLAPKFQICALLSDL